jgi:hypothetical protein
MEPLRTDNLEPLVKGRIVPFFQEILEKAEPQLHSLHLIGSALTADFIEKVSDINSIIVLKEMDLKFLDILAPMGQKYRKQGIAAPLTLTPDAIMSSLDVFPIEFLGFKLNHHTVWGEDLLAGLTLGKSDLKRQCERELKSKLIWLRKGYIAAAGDKNTLAQNIIRSFTGYLPLFRAVIYLMGQEPPGGVGEVLAGVEKLTGTGTRVFEEIYAIKKHLLKPSQEELFGLFSRFYQATARLGEIVDGLQTA